MQEATRGAEGGPRGGQGLGTGSVGTEQRAGTQQRQGELAEESGGPAGTGTTPQVICGRASHFNQLRDSETGTDGGDKLTKTSINPARKLL